MWTELTMYSGTVTGDGDTKANPIDVHDFKGGAFTIKCAAITGGTLTVKVMTYDPITAAWYELAAFTALSAAGQERKVVSADIGTKIALEWTYAGTTATFQVGANLKDI